ncbi:glycosyltransferase family 2 protein [Cellulomonas sp. zg-ZUI222]|uniref:Glycosyltransferase family 2 protein n=1 Tax=Cellulomonas wangleii TaxID=2816956 RepID=A0ABX8D142_9CELL|nr:glycosyltransferase family 2 protein [Cellulomonas wangleii]MBO0921209.1 glycosyltransferase family 2 protein [Cellulomonas wangleii]MBO0925309.1 glycosyltransferase family 2 protein [Cellulomonas wangleii]QVI61193.1 glycosyltransferase family 2 protein [Cellulomonas wangleii]
MTTRHSPEPAGTRAPTHGTTTPRVRVVCVVYHPGDELARFAETLATASRGPVELVVVDNGTDHTVAESVVTGAGGRLLVPGSNLGYGAAANRGAAGADAPWVVVANSDIEWTPGSLDRLVAAGEEQPSAGALGPMLMNTDGTMYPSARALPSLRQGAGHALFARLWPDNPWTRAYHARQESTGGYLREAGWLSGACLLLRREAFEQVGGFDESYFMFFEDVDLGERLGRAGWENLYVPDVRVTHVGGTSWRERPAPMIRAHHASALQYLERRYGRWYQAPVRIALRAGLRLRERQQLRSAAR